MMKDKKHGSARDRPGAAEPGFHFRFGPSAPISENNELRRFLLNNRTDSSSEPKDLFKDYQDALAQVGNYLESDAEVSGSKLTRGAVFAVLGHELHYVSITILNGDLVCFVASRGELHSFSIGERAKEEIIAEFERWNLHPTVKLRGSVGVSDDERVKVIGEFSRQCLRFEKYQALRRHVVDRFLSYLPKNASQILLRVDAGLTVFPFHILIGMASKNSGGLNVTYTPGIETYIACGDRKEAQTDNILVVGDPRGNLPYSAIEGTFAWRNTEEVERLIGPEATADRVRRGLNNARIFHYSGHAKFQVDHPEHSALLLADHSEIRLYELFEDDFSTKCDLVILNACESGFALGRVYDAGANIRLGGAFQGFAGEGFSLSYGFLSAGAKCVLSTQWPMHDLSSFLLIQKFVENAEHGMTYCDALSDARNWLKNSFSEEGDLRKFLDNVTNRPNLGQTRAEIEEYLDHLPSRRPFVDPIHWAGYILTGDSLQKL